MVEQGGSPIHRTIMLIQLLKCFAIHHRIGFRLFGFWKGYRFAPIGFKSQKGADSSHTVVMVD